MPSITFDLETVTPLFLSGANQQEAELRPPAFRGALRYWFRAIAASITTFDQVKNWENNIFGNTDAGGSVIIRVRAKKAINNCVLKRNNDFPGIVYLFFSTYGDKKREARGCFPPGSHFQIILQTRLAREVDIKCLHLALGAMWMLINLGGIGSRSNRGAGNLKVAKEPESNYSGLKFKTQANNIEQLASEISQGIQSIKQLYADIINCEGLSFIAPTPFEILSDKTSNVYLWQSDNQDNNDYWDNLLDDFGNKFSNFRLRYKNATQHDYKEVKDWLSSGGQTQITTIKRAAFGLPLQFRFTSLPGKQASVVATGDINRISSPLHIRIIELSNQKVALLIVYFKTQLLPPNQRLLIKSKNVNKPIRVAIPNQDIIEKGFIPFINIIKEVDL